MTVSDQTNRTSVVGTGAEQEIPFTFPITNTSDITVYKRLISSGAETELDETTHYTVVIDGTSGGTVTTVTPFFAATYQIHVIRDTPMTQTLDLVQGGSFNAENIETALDKSVRLIIENSNSLDRTLRFPETDADSIMEELPDAPTRAGKFLYFGESDGNPSVAESITTGETTISTYGKTLIDDDNASAALTTLGFTPYGKSLIDDASAAIARGTLGLDTDDDVEFADGTFTDIITKFPYIDVRAYGAVGNGTTDDTSAIQAAIDAGNTDGTPVLFPPGTYKCTAPLTSEAGTHPIWKGAGAENTQIYQATADTDLFQLATIEGFHISKMTLGTVAGTSGSVLKMTNVHRGTLEDIEIPGWGYRGISLLGCLLNTFKNVVVSHNLSQPSWCDGTQVDACIYLNDATAITCNGNTFVGCTLEGGEYGYYFDDAGSAGNTILGGVAEGNNTYSIYAKNIRGVQIVGLWTEESSGTSDSRIYLDSCDGWKLNMAYSAGIDLVNCETIRISGRCHETITIDSDCVLCEVDSIRIDAEMIDNSSDSSHVLKVSRSTPPKTYGTVGLIHTQYLISNGGSMEDWVSSVPVPFTNEGSATIAEETTTKKYGTNSAHITKDSANTYQGLKYDIPIAFRNQWITAEAWVYVVTGEAWFTWYSGTPRHVKMTTTGKWIKHTASFFYGAAETRYLIFGGTYVNNNDEFYIDGVKIWSEFNPYSGVIEFDNTDATPSVHSPGGDNVFKTQGTTAITNFDGGYIGQTLTIIATASIVITDNANIVLAGDANYDMTDTDALFLVKREDGKWYESSRSVN